MPAARGSMDWQGHGSCVGEDPNLFDAMRSANTSRPGRDDRQRIRAAKKICAGCPVQSECLLFGIDNKDSGVFGGQYVSKGRLVYIHEPAYQHSAPPKPRKRRAA